MVAPALIVAAHNIPGAPEDWKELPPESAALLVEFGADDDAELDRARGRGGRGARGPRAARAARRSRRDARGDRARLAGARGDARAGRQAAPARARR